MKNIKTRNSFDKITLFEILKGGLEVGGAVALVHILQAVALLDFGDLTAVITGVCFILIKAIEEWRSGV
jgi:hypothetical protein